MLQQKLPGIKSKENSDEAEGAAAATAAKGFIDQYFGKSNWSISVTSRPLILSINLLNWAR